MMTTSLYLSTSLLTHARAALRAAASVDADATAEGLACLRNAKPGYLINLIPANHPDRVRAARIVRDATR